MGSATTVANRGIKLQSIGLAVSVRVDIFTYYFVYLEYFPILLIYLESLFYRLSFDIIFA